MIPIPHGGRLVQRVLSAPEADRLTGEIADLPKLRLEVDQIYDAALLARGAFSPLDGFMDRTTLSSVVASMRLPDQLPWPIPVLLTPPGREAEAVIAGLRPGDEVALLDPAGRFVARLHFREKFSLERSWVAKGVYGTTDARHPNVAALYTTGATAVAGRVDLLRPPEYRFPEAELTPAQTREMFSRVGWKNVAAFQTRNPPHYGHEHLHRLALERDDVDGLFIHPVVGPLKPGDYRPEVVMESYRAMISAYYPKGRVALATLSLAMRYAGPRAALFFAIVRKNYGCSHYIVGRDQAGVGDFYEPYACHQIFDDISVGIVPLRYREMAWCARCGQMVSEKTCAHPEEARSATSQTRIRRALAQHRPLPVEILRPEVADILRRSDPLNVTDRVPVPIPSPVTA